MKQLSYCAVLVLAGSAVAQVRYAVVDLGQIPASQVCPCFQPTAMSETGHVVGLYYAPDDERRSFRAQALSGSPMQDIGTLDGISQAADVNDSGVATGYSVDAANRQRAVRFVNGQVVDIGVLQGGTHANGNAINNAGWIVGMSQKKFGPDIHQRATLWIPGSAPQDLGTFGGPFAEAFGVNNNGQVVGWAWTAQWRQRAFLWSVQTGMIDLGTLGGVSATATSVSDNGIVIGTSDTADGFSRAFKWTAAGGMVQLPVPANAIYTIAAGVNSAGTIVGSAFLDTCEGQALIWTGNQVQDVNTLLPTGSPWHIIDAGDIDNQGRIAGTARLGNTSHAVMLIPVPTKPTGVRR